MASIPGLRDALWPTVDAEQRIADFHANVGRLAHERQVQNDPVARLLLATEVLERSILKSSDRLTRRWKWAFWVTLAAMVLWTAITLALR